MTQAFRFRLLRLAFRSSILITLASTFGGGIVSAQGAENNSSTMIDVVVSRGRLTVDVRNAPLAQVLRAIAERAGLQVNLRGDISTPVTQSFADLALDEGIGRITRGHSLTLMYAASTGERGGKILTGVWVIGGSSPPDAAATAENAKPTAASLSQGAGNPIESEQSSAKNESASESVAETAESPATGQIRKIQALTEEAFRGSDAAVADLGDMVATEPDATVRLQAVAALGGIKGPEVDAVLTEALADVDTSVRVRAVRGLRGSGAETAVQSLAEVLAGDPDSQVRFAALRALTSIPDPTTLRTLELATSDPDALVRDTAARGLSWWKAHPPEVR